MNSNPTELEVIAELAVRFGCQLDFCTDDTTSGLSTTRKLRTKLYNMRHAKTRTNKDTRDMLKACSFNIWRDPSNRSDTEFAILKNVYVLTIIKSTLEKPHAAAPYHQRNLQTAWELRLLLEKFSKRTFFDRSAKNPSGIFASNCILRLPSRVLSQVLSRFELLEAEL